MATRKKVVKKAKRSRKPVKVSALKKDGEMGLRPYLARKAADALITAFIWDHTREGFDYWSTVHTRLEALGQGKSS